MVRILRFHRRDSGSNPGMGRLGAALNYATEQDVGDIKGSQRQDVQYQYTANSTHNRIIMLVATAELAQFGRARAF